MKEKIIGEFICFGNRMVIVKLEHGTHVMTYDEWRRIYGRRHLERWENGKRVVQSRKTA